MFVASFCTILLPARRFSGLIIEETVVLTLPLFKSVRIAEIWSVPFLMFNRPPTSAPVVPLSSCRISLSSIVTVPDTVVASPAVETISTAPACSPRMVTGSPHVPVVP